MTNGSIRLDSLACPDMRLHNTNGSITGTLAGDGGTYNIDSSTTNGSNSLPERDYDASRTRSLSADTTNGDIRLQFIN